MKHETSNLLIGLGIGAVVGVAVGYLMVADNRKKLFGTITTKKLAEEFDHAVSKVKEEVKDVYSKAKNKAENVKEHVTEDVNHVAEKVAGKTATETK